MSHDPFIPKPPRSALKRAANGDAPPDELAERRRLLAHDDPAGSGPPRPTDRPSLAPPVPRTNEPLSMPPAVELPPMEAFDFGPGDSTEARLETDDPWVFLRDPAQGLLGAFTASRVSAMVAAGEVAAGTEISFDRRQWFPAGDIDVLVNATDEGETLVVPPTLAEEAVAHAAKPPSAPPKVVSAARGSSVAAADVAAGASVPATFGGDGTDITDVTDDAEPPRGRAGRWLVALILCIAAGAGAWLLAQRSEVEPVAGVAAMASDPATAPTAVAPDSIPAPAAAPPAAAPDPAAPTDPVPEETLAASAAADEDGHPADEGGETTNEDGHAPNSPQIAPTTAPADAPAIEAAPARAEVAEAEVAEGPVARAPARRATRGVIAIETGRPLRVRLDGRDTGRTTPTRIRATAGRHTVEFLDADGSAVLRRAVRIRPGRTVAVDVRDQVSRIDAARQETARLNAAAAPDREAAAPSPAAPPPAAPTTAAESAPAATAPTEPIEAPTAPEAVAAAPSSSPVAAARVVKKVGGYISVSSSRPLRLHVDGKPTGKQTPVWMFPVDSGDRLVELFDESGARVAGRRTTVPERQTVPVLFKL